MSEAPASVSEGFATVALDVRGTRLLLPDLPEYRKFLAKLASGSWEPATFDAMERHLDRETVYLDIGAWIGVTPQFAAARAKAVVAVEPDPQCGAILRRVLKGSERIRLVEAALSSDASLSIHAVDGFGSSETSALSIGDGPSHDVPGISMAALLAMTGEAPVFAKVDIEGYEYAIGAELAKLSHPRVRAVQIAVHPQLLAKSLGGGIVARLRAALATWRLARAFKVSFGQPRLVKHSGVGTYILRAVLLRRRPKGADLLFERRLPSPGTPA